MRYNKESLSTVKMTVRFTKEEADAINEYCELHNVKKSDFIRKAIVEKLGGEDKAAN